MATMPASSSASAAPSAATSSAASAAGSFVPSPVAAEPPDPLAGVELAPLRARIAFLSQEEQERVERAVRFSAEAHLGQKRISGEPYVTHPVAVTEILAEWHMDVQALVAALLHDVMEDTAITKQTIAEQFGKVSADLVDGVSKLDKIEAHSQEQAQAENFRKMILAMARDVRVILIKLADRLHNMRTLDAVRPQKQRRIARETLEIYAPIANRLGLNNLFRELQELSFRYLYPLRYRVLSKAVRAARGNRREVVGKLTAAVQERLPQWLIEAEVWGREKHIYGIYRKMVEKQLTFSQVLDIYGFRVVVKDIPTCYLALGALHELYKPVPGKFKDYIAIPKGNGYQSLHTTLIGPYGTPLEIQIRTREMHQVAESGVASHWLYKDSADGMSDIQQRTHNWLQSLLELQSTSGDSTEFLEHVKIDLFPGEVFVFSPKGQIYNLPRGATAVDFAYSVHTDIGNRCVACRINGDLMPLRTELKNGDQVEIITAAHASPNPAWLAYVRTGRARAQIRHFLKTSQQEESIALGERLLNHALRGHGLTLGAFSSAIWDRLLREIGAHNREEVFTDIGLGKRLPAILAKRLAALIESVGAEDADGQPVKPRAPGSILIRGSEGMTVQLAKCCRPIPGDPIVGLMCKGQGMEVHMNDCPNLSRNRADRERWVDVEWEPDGERLFDVAIRIITENRRGVLAKVAAAIAEQQSNIQHVSMDGERAAHTQIYFTVQVSDRPHLARVMRALRRIPEVVRIARLRSTEQK
ncbi:bifunctional (p)ppGpp synthetase/guanosine-3',5'-bis(diphosphate) 3'-pyrophosphohydrolase [Niveibacterium sp. SC-1]|uniref:RelA/SpoT family protein n=2 Tax=Niveibacterium sp. SC-1 TaxID=3135646 RepID=UPI00311F97C5